MFRRIAGGLEWIGVLGLISMLAFTVVDVIGAKVLQRPLAGATEWVGFMQIVAIGAALAIGLFTNRHITITFAVNRMPRTFRRVNKVFVSLLGLVFFSILAWQSIDYGLSLRRAGEVSSSAGIPLYPFAFFLALCAAVAALFFVSELLPSRDSDSQREAG